MIGANDPILMSVEGSFFWDPIKPSTDPFGYPMPSGAWGAPVRTVDAIGALATELSQLRSDFESLSDGLRKSRNQPVSSLRSSLEEVAAPPRGYDAHSADAIDRELGGERTGNAWCDLLGYAADADECPPASVVESGRRALSSADPAVRAVAGRALVATGSEDNISLVEKMSAVESNSVVKRILISAVRGARI
jgi:hypothetical protein